MALLFVFLANLIAQNFKTNTIIIDENQQIGQNDLFTLSQSIVIAYLPSKLALQWQKLVGLGSYTPGN